MIKPAGVVLLLWIGLPSAALAGTLEANGCYAVWDEQQLKVGNTLFERVWSGSDKGLTACSFVLKGSPAIAIIQEAPPNKTGGQLAVTAVKGRRSVVGSEGIRLDVAVKGTELHFTLWVWPETGGVLISQSSGAAEGGGRAERVLTTGAESDGSLDKSVTPVAGADSLRFKALHLRVTEFELMDQTDRHDELLFEREWLLMSNEAAFDIRGCVLNGEDVISGSGVAFVRLAPLPHARHDKESVDFKVDPRNFTVSMILGEAPAAAIAYRGGRVGFTRAMQGFQRALRNYRTERDGLFLSNTWGDRSRDARINEAFLLQEVAAGARLGVDIVQIDDGWQKGRSQNSVAARGKGVWNGYWAADPEFWDADPGRFPNGLAGVVDAARKHGMHFGLWFGPDSSSSAANWKRDADHLLAFHRLGVNYFKIDSMKTHDQTSLDNQRAMFDRMLEGSEGQMVFDLDVTAEIRPGYFGLPDIGPLFVENRYTDFHRYWPHQTLRNLWELARVVDPLRLRMELLNNTRNAEKYPNDPLAPVLYRPDTLFAITMMASPLGWFEVSNLPEEYVAQLQPLVSLWKKERARMHGGSIIPVGQVPDGLCWTGFASVAADNSGGYLLLFRELNASSAFELPLESLFDAPLKAAVIGGRGTAELKERSIRVDVPEKLDYIWVKLMR